MFYLLRTVKKTLGTCRKTTWRIYGYLSFKIFQQIVRAGILRTFLHIWPSQNNFTDRASNYGVMSVWRPRHLPLLSERASQYHHVSFLGGHYRKKTVVFINWPSGVQLQCGNISVVFQYGDDSLNHWIPSLSRSTLALPAEACGTMTGGIWLGDRTEPRSRGSIYWPFWSR